MSKINKKNNWVYEPDPHDSMTTVESFRRKHIISDKVLELIGEEEANKIDFRVKQMLHQRELMYGVNSERVDYKTPILYFTNSDFPGLEVKCVSGARMNKHNEHRFTKNKDKASIYDYTIEVADSIKKALR